MAKLRTQTEMAAAAAQPFTIEGISKKETKTQKCACITKEIAFVTY